MNSADAVYSALVFPSPPLSRPYCFINMVTTIDGKILSGSRGDHVLDLGSMNDHVLMKRIEASADGLLVGAQTLRVAPLKWAPLPETRVVVSSSGDLPYGSTFFKNGRPVVACPVSAEIDPGGNAMKLEAGTGTVDLPLLLYRLRNELGILRLLVLGGSELNAQLLAADLVDELFVTIAPKVKLGRDVPTYADGNPLPRESLQQYKLVESHVIGDEVFIRYRREGSGQVASTA